MRIDEKEERGLNLTRATLNAILKCPWLRKTSGKRHDKWSAYDSEEEVFNWARSPWKGDDRKTLEAEIMDFADDIAYSIYDLEDFYKAGKIPLERLIQGHPSAELDLFLKGTFERWQRDKKQPAGTEAECRSAITAASALFPLWPYSGTRSQRGFLRDMTSFFVAKYIVGISLHKPAKPTEARVEIDLALKREMRMLQELTWHYVIKNPALATQQHGYRKVIKGLFDALLDAIKEGNWALFPPSVSELIRDTSKSPENVRIVADFIASMSEPQALELYQRLMGISIGSFLKSIH